MLETSLLECCVVDLPVIKKFPSSSEDEWENYRRYGLRSADAYLLVYDVTMPSSFTFLQHMREQIAMSIGLGDVPIVVAANKTDLVNDDFTPDIERESYRTRHNISTKVKKAWKLHHIECSTKYNWNVSKVFKELATDIIEFKNVGSEDGKKEGLKCCLACV